MADLAVTAANVVRGINSEVETGIAGAAIAAGEVVYKDASDAGKFKLSDCNSGTSAVRVPYGIALNSASANQPLAVHKKGRIVVGAAVTTGSVYCLSGTAGKIRPVADNVAGDYVSVIGVAVSVTEVEVCFISSPAATV